MEKLTASVKGAEFAFSKLAVIVTTNVFVARLVSSVYQETSRVAESFLVIVIQLVSRPLAAATSIVMSVMSLSVHQAETRPKVNVWN